MSRTLGVVAGTGFYALSELEDVQPVSVNTAYGQCRASVGELAGVRTVFIARHGVDHSVPPHLVNYRAIIQALADLEVDNVLAVNVVGGIGLESGELVVVDDVIDFTRGRVGTFFDGSTPEGVVHVDMSEPYDSRLRRVLIDAARACGVEVVTEGVYGAFEGPRFETPAEIRMARTLGVTVVGMTGMPEVVLAKERGLPYASLCLVANPAAGLGPPISIDEIRTVIDEGAGHVQRVLVEAAVRIGP